MKIRIPVFCMTSAFLLTFCSATDTFAQGFGGAGGFGSGNNRRYESTHEWQPGADDNPLNPESALSVIKITGTAEIRVVPDQIRLVVAVTSEAETADQCRNLVRKQVAGIVGDWKQLNIADENIVEDFISVLPRYEWNLIDKEGWGRVRMQQQSGFRMQTNLHVAVPTEAAAMDAIDRAFRHGNAKSSPSTTGAVASTARSRTFVRRPLPRQKVRPICCCPFLMSAPRPSIFRNPRLSIFRTPCTRPTRTYWRTRLLITATMNLQGSRPTVRRKHSFTGFPAARTCDRGLRPCVLKSPLYPPSGSITDLRRRGMLYRAHALRAGDNHLLSGCGQARVSVRCREFSIPRRTCLRAPRSDGSATQCMLQRCSGRITAPHSVSNPSKSGFAPRVTIVAWDAVPCLFHGCRRSGQSRSVRW